MRSVLGDTEAGGEVAYGRRRSAGAVAVAGSGDERFERSPCEWAERASRLFGHRAEQERVPTRVDGRRSWRMRIRRREPVARRNASRRPTAARA